MMQGQTAILSGIGTGQHALSRPRRDYEPAALTAELPALT